MNLSKLKEIMAARGMDAVVAVSPDNVLYSAGTYIMTQKIIPDRLAFVVFTLKDDPVLIVCGIEESLAQEESWIRDIRTYVEFQESPVESLVKVLKEKNLNEATIGIEKHYLALAFAEEFTTLLPKARLVECGTVFEELRAIKEPQEIEVLEYAAKATLKAIEDAFSAAKPGDTEKKVATDMIKAIFDMGAEETGFMVLGTGNRSSIVHNVPSEVPLRPGDIVRVDFGGMFKGYWSDVARTAVVGKPTSKQEHILRSLAQIQREVIINAKVGVKFSSLYNLCKDMFAEKGLPFFMPHIGHGMGLGLHEEPMISPLNHEVLKENMILNIEPLCVDKESGSGYHIEDLVLVTKDGPRVLTGSDLSDEPIIIK